MQKPGIKKQRKVSVTKPRVVLQDDADDMFAMAIEIPRTELPPEVVNARRSLQEAAPAEDPQDDGTSELFQDVLAQAASAKPTKIDSLHPVDARRTLTLQSRDIREARIAKKAERAAMNEHTAAVASKEADNRQWNRRKVEALPKKVARR